MKFLNSFQPLGLAILRLALALIFIYHGYPKLVRADAMMREFFVQHGFPGYFVGLAGILECVGGGLLLIGLFTRPAAFVLSGEMAAAYFIEHFPRSFFPIQSEGDLAVALCFTFLYLAFAGGGPWSLDAMFAAGKLDTAAQSGR